MTNRTRLSNPLFDFHKQVAEHPEWYCSKIKQAVEKQKRMLERYDFIEEKGRRCVDWIERFCILTEGEHAGRKVKLMLFQKWIIYSILCFWGNFEVEAYDHEGEYIGKKEKYLRVVNDVLLMPASGNAKTSLVGFMNAYFMFSDEFPSCKIYIGSNAYKQSRLCFDTTKNIISSNPLLKRFAKIRSSIGEIEIERNGSKLVAMSSDGSNLEGIIPAVLVIDEIHEMKTSKYADDLRKSTKRDDFLVIETTTEGTVRGGYLDQRKELATNLLNGTAEEDDDRKFFAIFEQDSIEEILDLKDDGIMKKSNPGLGIAVSVTLLKEKIKAMKNDPKQKVSILTKNFNIPQNPITSFFSEAECKAKSFSEDIFNGAPVFLGLDMAYTRNPKNDLACLEILTVDPITENEYCKDFYFIPKYWEHEVRDEDGTIRIVKEDMIPQKSKEDSNILYNRRTKKYGYQMYADRGDVVIIDEALVEALVAEFGEQARTDCTGVTEQFIIFFIAHLEMKYKWILCKFGLDPNKANQIQAFCDANITSIDGKPPTIKFRMEDKRNSNPIIESTKERRARGLVYNNNRLSELHFAAAQAKEDSNGYITFTNAEAQKKDGVIANLAARSAYNVFVNNKDTGEQNRRLLMEWWNANGTKDIQD